jgi:peptide-methionine (R)-S-oxide reductase
MIFSHGSVEMSKKIEKSDQQWQEQLTEEQFRVCRQQGTEAPFTGAYHDCKEEGVYRCICCGAELFRSAEKFDSGSGWPSFWEQAEEGAVETRRDSSHGMERVEVRCSICGAHLGHVFPDGPQPTGLRYCINSVALQLTKD